MTTLNSLQIFNRVKMLDVRFGYNLEVLFSFGYKEIIEMFL